MSYGRDPSRLGAVGSFRQMGGAFTQKPKTGKAGSGAGLLFRDKYSPSMIKPDVVRLLRGSYEMKYVPMDAEGNPLHYDADGRPEVATVMQPMIAVCEHRDQRSDHTTICSGGPLRQTRKYREPCLGCDTHWAQRVELKGQKKRPAMGMADKFVVSVLHYAYYHKGPQLDSHGQMKLNPNTNEPYLEWSPCAYSTYGFPCRNCQEKRETKLGHVMHWSMGYGHWNSLLSKQTEVGDHCTSCGGVNCVRSLAWLCRFCDEAVIDLSNTQRTPEEIVKMTTTQIVCPHCRQAGFLNEDIGCMNCSKPSRATLFDVDLWVMRVKQGTGDNETTVLQPSQTSAPTAINNNYAEIAKPLDLPKIYAPTPLDVQARLFQLPMPGAAPAPTPMTADQAARPYAALPTPAPPTGGPALPQGMYKP